MSRAYVEQFAHVIFDFDGVILDSNGVKEKAFQNLFEEYGASATSFVSEFHRANLGIPRDRKIEHFLRYFAKQEPADELVRSYCSRFAETTLLELVKAEYLMRDVVDFLKENHKQRSLYVASAARTEDVRYLCEAHEISKYFIDIQGSPRSKAAIIADYIGDASPDQYVMIGDSINDYEAASANNIPFAGFNNTDLLEVGTYLHSLT